MINLIDLRAKAEAAPADALRFVPKSFGYQLVDSDGYAHFTWKPECWNDPAKEQHLHPHQEEALSRGIFIAAATPKTVLALIEALEVADRTLEMYSTKENWQMRVSYRCGDGCCTNYDKDPLAVEDGGNAAVDAIAQIRALMERG